VAYRTIVAIYGVINALGGLMAYMMPGVKSLMSLIVGGLSGAALVACAVVAKKNPGLGLRAAGALTLLLSGFWVYRIVSLAGAAKSVGVPAGNLVLSLAVLGALAVGHFAAQRKSP
jgi:uncharacterized membrane protein (UPF0136 family)